MKKLYYILLILPFLASGQTPTENWVKTKAYKQGVTAVISTPTAAEAAVQVTYFDGLGRQVQQVGHQQSPSGKDIISLVEYDAYGRQSKQYLPYPSSTNAMEYIADAANIDIQYYEEQYGSDGSNPYSESVFEDSPLSKVLKQAAPGDPWKINSLGDDHSVKIDYLVNEASDEVKMFKATSSWDTGRALYTTSLENSSGTVYYPVNELYKTVLKDENWISGSGTNHTTEEFKDKTGRLILKRVYGESIINGTPTTTKHDTYYVYDQFGNLSFVMPPMADGNVSTTVLSGLCYQYLYDHRNRLVEKKLPGKDWEFMVYDILDRIVATGPAYTPFGGTDTGWLVTKYDALNRPVYTGWYNGHTATSASRKTLQDLRNAQVTNLWETRNTGTTVAGVTFNYTNLAFPTTGYIMLTVTYYDTYGFPGTAVVPTTVEDQDVSPMPKGLVTGSWARALKTSQFYGEAAAVFYDLKGRPIRTYSKNYLGGFTQTDSKLDFTGKPLYTVTNHMRSSVAGISYVKDSFTYNDQDMLLTHIQQLGTNGTPELLVKNEYNEIGQLIGKNIGGTDLSGNTPLQKADYSYNIRGWLKDINNIGNLIVPGFPKDLFAYSINYNTVGSTPNYVGEPLFNGNISETYWRTSSDDVLRKYGYQYDNLNRLKKATYIKGGTMTNTYNESATYDKNGNIRSMYRTGGGDAQNLAVDIDILTYSYTDANNPNRLIKVFDTETTEGFKDDVPTGSLSDPSDDYTYDAYGNMLTDQNKAIATAITYNHLNQPTRIYFSTTPAQLIDYIYDANGNKLTKIVYTSATNTTDYLDGFVYKNASLEFLSNPEGYAKPNPDGSFSYIYQYKDHLGNVRLSYSDADRNGTIAQTEIIEEDHYYPFGLKHKGYNEIVSTLGNQSAQKIEYNGKEFQDEAGLNLYDFGARNYEPALGRWMNMDPLAETSRRFSPYTYALNNPVFFIDPDGMEATDFKEATTMSDVKEETGESSSDDDLVNRGYGNLVSHGDNVASVGSFSYDDQEKPKKNKKSAKTLENNPDSPKEYKKSAKTLEYEKMAVGMGLTDSVLAFLTTELVMTTAGIGSFYLYATETTAAKAAFTVEAKKFDYFFGRVVVGAQDNVRRSAQNLKDLTTLGIKSEGQLMKIFNKAIKGNIVKTQTTKYGTTVTRSVNIGNKGRINVGFFYEGGNMNVIPRIATLIPQIF